MGGNSLRTETYYTRKERNKIVKAANANGESVIHDNFLENDLKELILDVRVDVIPPSFYLHKALEKRLANDTLTFKDMKILMRLERGMPLLQTTLDKIKSGIINFFNRN